jgi:amidase
LKQYDVQVLVAPSGLAVLRVVPINGDVWSNDWPGFGGHTARVGYPNATASMGGIYAISVGLSLVGAKNSDVKMLSDVMHTNNIRCVG